ncbi:putative DNA-binding domain-containing protein [Thiotrichales bacterium 19S3-7]|nr:putative DNA-binding domain-containing protein [Thiotrichales bacterium 19S3-7]MCF6802446.1 putative DNA-binding domain-containing protein [Thiotrichales bacterium 19S3-11]
MKIDFQQLQITFAKQIRYGNTGELKEISNEQLAIYRSCFISGVNEILSNCFPILSEILQGERWQFLIKDFYANYPAKTPLFYEMPEEFLCYLLEVKPLIDEVPYLNELAHYEWMELALDIAEGQAPMPIVEPINLQHAKFALSPLAEVVAYHYKVHQISLSYQPQVNDQQLTYLCIYRNYQDEVKFIQLNALTAKFLLMLKEQAQLIDEALNQIVSQLHIAEREKFIESSKKLVLNFLNKGILYVS